MSHTPTIPFCRASFSVIVDQAAATTAVPTGPLGTDRIDYIVETINPVGVLVTSYQVLWTGSALSSADWTTLGRWRIDESPGIQYDTNSMMVTFTLVDFTQQIGDRTNWGVLVTKNWLTAFTGDVNAIAPDATYGAMLPHIFGAVADAPCLLLQKAPRGFLYAQLTMTETGSMELTGIEGVFPSSGNVLIGQEFVSYATKTAGGSGRILLHTLTRGARETTAAAHYTGEEVISEQTTYQYIVAGHQCTGITTVKGNGMRLTGGAGAGQYAAAVQGGVQLINLKAPLPMKTEYAPGTSLVRLNQLASGWGWEAGLGNEMADWSSAVNQGSLGHTTYCTVSSGQTLAIKEYSGHDLSSRLGTIVRSWLLVTYQAVRSVENGAASAYPTGDLRPAILLVYNSQYQIIDPTNADGDTDPGIANIVMRMPEPSDTDAESGLYPEGDETGNSTGLFAVNLGEGAIQDALESVTEFNLVFQGVASPQIQEVNVGGGNTETAYWWYDVWAQNLTDGGDLRFEIQRTINANLTKIPLFSAKEGGSWAPASGAIRAPVLQLRARDDISIPDGVKMSKVEAHFVLCGLGSVGMFGFPSEADITATATVTLAIGGQTQSANVSVGWNETRTQVVTIEAPAGQYFDRAALLAAFVRVMGYPVSDIDSARFGLQNIRLFGLQKTEFIGSPTEDGTPLESLVTAPSSWVTQRIDLSSIITAWSWFNGALAPTVYVIYPDGTPGTTIRVTDIDFEVEVKQATTRVPTEDEVELTATVYGYVSNGKAYARGLDVIKKLLGNNTSAVCTPAVASDYYGLTADTDYDATSLGTAIADAEEFLGPETYWRLDRRIAQLAPLRDIL
ncbi:MAG TPA: hypothetical protein VMY69_01580, partial [Phycisphaerae bacterium]|nr:hypothetical protein [Phycisphaerae bacterium]